MGRRVKTIKITISILIILFGSLLSCSYIVSRKAAFKMVGETIQYFPLKNSALTVLPIYGNCPVWGFRFLHIKCSEDFEIYTSLMGEIVKTFPRENMAEVFREYETMEVHPYSLEGLKTIYGPDVKDK